MIRLLKSFIGSRSPLRLGWHKAKAFLAAVRYGFPARKLSVIGITGTDGKTTTVGMTAHILNTAGIPTGALSTAFFQVRSTITWNATQKTSPSPFMIQKFLRQLVRQGCTHAVLEVSSHGLVQHRLDYTWPVAAAITNISPEHLDYHGSMNQYIADKGILFRMLNGLGTKVLNINDQTFKEYHPIKTNKTIAYSSESHASTRPDGVSKLVYLTDIHVSATGSSAILHQVEEVTNDEGKLTLSMAGAFNLENALAAFCLARACGIQTTAALTALSSFTGVAGRMERIPSPAPFAVFVDFTVTPEAYRKTLTSLRSMLEDGKRLLVLTGSCGERMREKRPLVGQICSELADVVIVTNEDPYGEDPEKIIDEVWAGIDQSKVQAHRISDRMKAITWIFEQATPGDIVLLAGKGSDTTMWVKEGKIPWNERDIAHSLLANLG